MQSNTHPSEWVQYISQSQSMVQNHMGQHRIGTFVILDQPPKIPCLKLVINQGRDIT
jgi:hypothetical protein